MTDVEIASFQGTALMAACKKGFIDVVELLITDGNADLHNTGCKSNDVINYCQF